MTIPLNTSDFCERARTLYADRLGAVDEPHVPDALGRLSYGELLRRCDGMIATLDTSGCPRARFDPAREAARQP